MAPYGLHAQAYPYDFTPKECHDLWNTCTEIFAGKRRLYWEPVKSIKEMTPRERDRYLGKHLNRWKRGGHGE